MWCILQQTFGIRATARGPQSNSISWRPRDRSQNQYHAEPLPNFKVGTRLNFQHILYMLARHDVWAHLQGLNINLIIFASKVPKATVPDSRFYTSFMLRQLVCAHTHLYCTIVYHGKRKLSISRSCLILVLTTVLGRPRRADVKNDVKNYQGPLLPQKMRLENT
jgi:hypothetical protein